MLAAILANSLQTSPIAASIIGASVVTANLLGVGTVAVVIEGTSAVACVLTGIGVIGAAISGISAVEVSLIGIADILVEIVGTSAVIVDLTGFAALGAEIFGTSTVIANLLNAGAFSAALFGTSSVTCLLGAKLNANQILMLSIIAQIQAQGIHISVETLISTVCLWAVGHGFSYKWVESNSVEQVTSDWTSLLATGLVPPNVVTND